MDERVQLTVEQALERMADGEQVHTFRNPVSGVLIGADWERGEVIAHFEKYGVEEAGPAATEGGHGLVCIDTHGPLFVATKEAGK